MNLKSIPILLFGIIVLVSCGSHSAKKGQVEQDDHIIAFVSNESEKSVDILVDGKLFTSYCWPDSIMKPILYPVMTSAGTEITRGFPINPKPGERTDHPHQVGIWFNYGNVNGYDFWNNSSAIPAEKKGGYGTIKHISIDKLSDGTGHGLMATTESWIDPSGIELLSEKTEYHIISKGSTRIIDRITTLTAKDTDVSMKDTKEGMFAIRVARQLELPSKDEVIMYDAQGNPTTVDRMSNEGISGSYRSSEGITNDSVFGKRAKWMDLYGNIGDEKISVVICDHPENPGYPAYWQARGYGLFSANPLGASIYTNGRDVMNYSIPAGKSSTFRFRMIIHSGDDLTDDEIYAYASEFARMH